MKKLFVVLLAICFLGFSADFVLSKSFSGSSSSSRSSSGSSGGSRSFSGSGSSGGSKSFSGSGSSGGSKSFSGSGSSGKSSSSPSRSFSGSSEKSSSTGSTLFKSGSDNKSKFDTQASKAMAKQDSAKSYDAYKHKNFSPDLAKTRDFRSDKTFSQRSPNGYYSPSRTTVIYKDNYNNNFLMYASIFWMFHHWDTVDRSRFSDDKIRELEVKVKQLEATGLKRDPSYTDPGVDEDLQYNKDVLKYSSGIGTALLWIGGIIGVLALAGFGYWVIFMRKF